MTPSAELAAAMLKRAREHARAALAAEASGDRSTVAHLRALAQGLARAAVQLRAAEARQGEVRP